MVNTIIYCEYNPEYLFSQIQWESSMSLDGLWNSTFYGVELDFYFQAAMHQKY